MRPKVVLLMAPFLLLPLVAAAIVSLQSDARTSGPVRSAVPGTFLSVDAAIGSLSCLPTEEIAVSERSFPAASTNHSSAEKGL